MNILALDTSSRAASCAILQEGILTGEFFVNTGLTHSQTIMPMVEALLAATGTTVNQMDLFAVSVGPGSFTGLRIGIAAIKALAMALNKPCAGVSTLQALAGNATDFSGHVVPVMDARRAQVYTALYASQNNRQQLLCADDALSIEALGQRLTTITGPKLLIGDGAALCKEKLAHIPDLQVAAPGILHQRAGSVALAAAALPANSYVTAAELTPVYLRLPQAERELRARQNVEKA